MNRLSILRLLSLLTMVVLAVTTLATTDLNDELAVQRPISDFIEAQGSFCLDDGRGGCSLSAPPVANFLVWTSPRQNRAASVDYAGLANRAIVEAGGTPLGTVTEGSVLERRLADGRAEVTVTLHTRKALTWVIEGDGEGNFDFSAGPLLFGHRVVEVRGGARPALGDSVLEVVFTNPAPGEPLPDLDQILFAPARGQELRFISFFASAGGQRSEATGAPDGTSGPMEVTQSGLLMARFVGGASRALPAERIDLDAVAAAPPACRGNRPCNDGNPCTSGDKCKNGVCVGTPYSCDDGNSCTTDTCDGAGGCNFTNNTVPCNDDNACTSNDRCSGGICVSGPPTVCNDGNVCTTDACDGAGGCNFTNNAAPCSDGNACTFGDTCGGGVCSAGTPYTCNDGNPCTDDACDGSGACIITPIAGCGCPIEFECYSGPNCPGGYFCDSFGCCVPHCADGVHNFSESDVDCGGSCPGCAAGMRCEQGFDCLSGVCVNGVCQ